jgi:hypothetical protein
MWGHVEDDPYYDEDGPRYHAGLREACLNDEHLITDVLRWAYR